MANNPLIKAIIRPYFLRWGGISLNSHDMKIHRSNPLLVFILSPQAVELHVVWENQYEFGDTQLGST